MPRRVMETVSPASALATRALRWALASAKLTSLIGAFLAKLLVISYHDLRA